MSKIPRSPEMLPDMAKQKQKQDLKERLAGKVFAFNVADLGSIPGSDTTCDPPSTTTSNP